MTIDEAIKTSKEILGSDRLLHWPEAEAATKLGLEALEAYKAGRDSDHYFNYPLLPSETEELTEGVIDLRTLNLAMSRSGG